MFAKHARTFPTLNPHAYLPSGHPRDRPWALRCAQHGQKSLVCYYQAKAAVKWRIKATTVRGSDQATSPCVVQRGGRSLAGYGMEKRTNLEVKVTRSDFGQHEYAIFVRGTLSAAFLICPPE